MLGVACMLFGLLASKTEPFQPDDSYISYRYAQNLADGHGLTFNPGIEPVEGYSNLLWILILAVFSKMGFELHVVAQYVGAFIGMLGVVLFWIILRTRELSFAFRGILLVAFGISAPLALYSVSGMETPLFSFLLLSTLIFLERYLKNRKAIFLVAIAVTGLLLRMTRPEGILLAPAIFGGLFLLHLTGGKGEFRKSIGSLAIGIGSFLVMWIAFEWWRIGHFGEYFPMPFYSKGSGGDPFYMSWKRNFRNYFMIQSQHFSPAGYYFLALLVFAVWGIYVAVREQWRKYFFEICAIGLFCMFGFVYLNFVDWMPGMRYYSTLASLLLISSVPIFTKWNSFIDLSVREGKVKFVAFVFLVIVVNHATFANIHYDGRRMEYSMRDSVVSLGKWLKKNVPADTRLAMSDVGATPYFSELTTLDINPASLTDKEIAKNGWSEDYFFEYDPGVVVFVTFNLQEKKFYPEFMKLTESERFKSTYKTLGVVRYDWFRNRGFWIYCKKEFQFSEEDFVDFPKGLNI